MTALKQTSDWREILNETVQALSRLDADGLEGIALNCDDLVRQRRSGNLKLLNSISIDRRNVEHDADVFERLLELTNANLAFMRGLSSVYNSRLEYGRVPVNMSPGTEVEYGDH